MPPSVNDDNSFLQLAERLGELEVVIGPKAGPVIEQVRSGLLEAMACRDRGDMSAALAAIQRAMDKLAALITELDPQEASLMRVVAQHFTRALGAGLKGEAKEAVNVMKHKAGDPKDDEGNQW
ncbi:MAG TPA: hypothetical protein VJX23_00830 [Candidatus Binataceae bacterium]|nr:hypothetical protein [Candidatus Binataceae bacterium]